MTEFSKKTGDYASLSAVDLRVLGLTLSMEREAHGGSISHLRTEPTVRPTVKQHGAVELSNKLPGFYNPGSDDDDDEAEEEKVGQDDSSAAVRHAAFLNTNGRLFVRLVGASNAISRRADIYFAVANLPV